MKSLVKHVKQFMTKHQLFPTHGEALVALSGGVDSMVLLDVLLQIKEITSVTALHINHQTREKENDAEQFSVLSFCRARGVKCIIRKMPSVKSKANFEMIARQFRYLCFEQERRKIGPEALIYTAHHLDDSFEWSLLQSLKSSRLEATVGIPVRSGLVRRPFLCLSKEQIRRYALDHKIPHHEDSSNLDTHFERNFLRQEIIPLLAERFPAYLRHYAARSSDLALALSRTSTSKKGKNNLKIVKDAECQGFILTRYDLGLDFTPFEPLIIELICRLSKTSRGVLRDQVQKLIAASTTGRFGPLSFSGGVLGFIAPGQIFLVHRDQLPCFERRDQILLQKLKKWVQSEASAEASLKENHYPFLIVGMGSRKENKVASLRRLHPLYPRSTQWLIEHGKKHNLWWQMQMTIDRRKREL